MLLRFAMKALSIVVGRDEQVSQDDELVVSELLFVVVPAVEMCSFECA